MTSDIINIDKNELSNLIRGIIREELNKVGKMSLDEQKELEHLYGDSLGKDDYNKENCVRLWNFKMYNIDVKKKVNNFIESLHNSEEIYSKLKKYKKFKTNEKIHLDIENFEKLHFFQSFSKDG